MNKVLFILGIASIVIAVIALLYAALQRFAYYHTLDGDSDMYARMHLHMIVKFSSYIGNPYDLVAEMVGLNKPVPQKARPVKKKTTLTNSKRKK